ncbi:MAG TPA: OmpA family protein [Kofleriaceae bacterium]|nr:OmpA family protein [Kofleriaceae bacterium]
MRLAPKLAALVPLLAPLLALGCHGGHSATPEPAPPAPPAADGDTATGAGDATASSGDDRPHYASFDLDDNRLVLPGPIVFSSGHELDEGASQNALWFIHDYLDAKDYVTLVRIEGHGDEAGQDALMETGEKALAVARWLEAHGIDCHRMLAAAFGDSKPIADASTPEGRAQNRRIEVINAELRGVAIGGMPTDGSAPAAVPVCDE